MLSGSVFIVFWNRKEKFQLVKFCLDSAYIFYYFVVSLVHRFRC